MEDTITPSVETTDKTPRQRSAQNPGVSIQDSIDFVKQLHKLNPTVGYLFQQDKVSDLVVSGNIPRDFSAAWQYGLLDKLPSEGYKTTILFKKLYAPVGDDFKEGILDAFKKPKLYQELIEKYNGQPLPSELPIILFRFHGIAEKAAKEVSEKFIDNAKYVGVFIEGGILNVPGVQGENEPARNENTVTNITPNNTSNSNQINTPPFKPDGQKPPLELPEHTNVETEKIKLAENLFITITYPKEMSTTNLKIFDKWHEMFNIRMGA